MRENVAHWVVRFHDWLDSRTVVRRAILAGSCYLVYDAYAWSKRFAETYSGDGTQIALIIAAVTGPATILLKFVMDSYSQARK